jgi:hypothetical protein
MLDTVVTNSRSEESAQYNYADTLATSLKVNWKIDDIIGGDKKLDFSKPFMPESLARVGRLLFLNDDEKRILNQIRGNTYLAIFGLVEEFILPFVLDHIRPSLDQDDYRVRAFLQFAGEEAKHIQLFKRFSEEFEKGFGYKCSVIGPPAEIAKAVLSHNALAVSLLILSIEWMSQAHYVDSIKDDGDLDALFKSLLKNHWLEEAQHAKLDTLMVESIADGLSTEDIEKAVDQLLAIGGVFDDGFKQQTLFELEAFETVTGRSLSETEKEEFIEIEHQASRWTFLGSGLSHPKFLETVERLRPSQRTRLEEVAKVFS